MIREMQNDEGQQHRNEEQQCGGESQQHSNEVQQCSGEGQQDSNGRRQCIAEGIVIENERVEEKSEQMQSNPAQPEASSKPQPTARLQKLISYSVEGADVDKFAMAPPSEIARESLYNKRRAK